MHLLDLFDAWWVSCVLEAPGAGFYARQHRSFLHFLFSVFQWPSWESQDGGWRSTVIFKGQVAALVDHQGFGHIMSGLSICIFIIYMHKRLRLAIWPRTTSYQFHCQTQLDVTISVNSHPLRRLRHKMYNFIHGCNRAR